MQAALENCLSRILVPDNNVRMQAEAEFQQMLKQPDQVAQGLMTVSTNPQAPAGVRSLSVVLLRSSIFTTKDSLWSLISPQTQAGVKQALLVAIQNETVPDIRNKLCDTTAELAVVVFNEHEGVSGPHDWPELLDFIFSMCQSATDAHKQSGLTILTRLALYLGPVLGNHLDSLKQVFFSGLKSTNYKVRLSALHATISFIEEVFDEQTRDQFQTLLPDMMQAVSLALNNRSEEDARSAMALFVELGESMPLFFRPQISGICELMATIASTTQLEDATRQFAVEFLVTLCESKPGMMRKLPNFVVGLVKICIAFILEVKDDDEWLQSDSAVEIQNPDIGSESLDRMCMCLRGQTMLPIFHQMLPQLLSNPDWRCRFAAIQTMCIMGEGCKESLFDEVEQLGQMLLPYFKDVHPRVRYHACNTLGQLCTDFVPRFQHVNAPLLLPPLMQLLQTETVPKVQAHTCSALINWAEGIEADSLLMYAEPLLQNLAIVLEKSAVVVQESAALAVAALAATLDERFVPFYPRFMPLLKGIATQAQGPKYRELRGNAITAISVLAAAVGPEVFRPDAAHVLPLMVELQQTPMPPDDPMIQVLMPAWARICSAMKSDFVPYLKIIIPQLLQLASLKPDIKLATQDNYDELRQENVYEFLALGDQNLAIRTSEMQTKGSACNMLYVYAEDLQEHFINYVKDATTVLAPLLQFYFDATTRAASSAAMPALLRCVARWVETQGGDPAVLQQMWSAVVLPAVLEGLDSEIDVQVWCDKVQRAKECLEVLGPGCLDVAQSTAFLSIYMVTLQRCMKRKAHLAKRQHEVDFDEVEALLMDDETEQNEALLSNLADLHAQIVRVNPATYVDLLSKLSTESETLVQLILRMVNEPVTPADTQIGVCMLDDIVEFTGPAGQALYPNVVPIIVAHIDNPYPEIRQASVYGAGVYAQVAPANDPRQMDIIGSIFGKLRSVIDAPDSRAHGNLNATENAISAVAKIIKFKPQCMGANIAQAVSYFVKSLPVEEDVIEAKVTYRNLLEFLEGDMPHIWGENNAHVPHLLFVLIKVLGTRLVKKKDNPRIVVLIRGIFTRFPKQAQEAASTLQPMYQQKLREVLGQ